MKEFDKLLNSLGNLLSDNLNRRVFLVSESQNGLAMVLFHDGNHILFRGFFHESELFSPWFKEKLLIDVEALLGKSNLLSPQIPSTQLRIFQHHQQDH